MKIKENRPKKAVFLSTNRKIRGNIGQKKISTKSPRIVQNFLTPLKAFKIKGFSVLMGVLTRWGRRAIPQTDIHNYS